MSNSELKKRQVAELCRRIEHLRTKAPERVDAFDVRSGNRLIAVLWTGDDGFCITEVSDDTVFDDTPDFVARSVDEALQFLMFLLDTSSTPAISDWHGDELQRAA